MPSDCKLSEGFQSCANKELDRLEAELRELDQRLAAISAERAQITPQIDHLRALLGKSPLPASPPQAQTSAPQRVRRIQPPDGSTDADRVVALLREHGQPIHYRDIHQRLVQAGVQVGGKDPAGTLLARYFDDPRLYRPARGTYGLVEWRDNASERRNQSPP